MTKRFLTILILVPFLGIAQNNNFIAYNDYNELVGKKIPKVLLNKISVSLEDVSFQHALSTIADKGELKLNYTKNVLPKDEEISLNLENVYAVEALFAILSDANLGLSITEGGHLVIVPDHKIISPAEEIQFLSGKVYGIVSDNKTGEPLVGANVFLEGTTIGATTDFNGEYVIISIPAGNFTLRVSYLGYKAVDLPIKATVENQVIDIELESVALEGEEVVVSAQVEGQFQAINQQLSANNIKNIVAADRIQELPDVNAAESIGRLPGVSITRDGGEANKVVIRGLSPKFNTVMVNGVEIPSTSRENRSVDLSMISSNMLSAIEVSKSLTPDMEANAIGGAVNMKLKDAPEGLHYELRSQGGYNGLSDKISNYLISGKASNRLLDDALGVSLNFNIEKVHRGSEQISGNYSVVTSESVMRLNNIRLKRQNEDRQRKGIGLVLDLNKQDSKYLLTSFFSRTERDYIKVTDDFNAEDNTRTYGVEDNGDYITDMISTMFHGENRFRPFNIDYNLSYIRTNRNEPDLRTWSFQEANAFENEMDQYSGVDGIIPFARTDLNRTYWHDIDYKTRLAEESDFTASLNLEIPFRFNYDIGGKFKFGGKYRYKSRTNDEHHLEGNVGNNGGSTRRDLIADKYLEGLVIRDSDTPWNLLSIQNIEDSEYKSSILDGQYNINWAPKVDLLNLVMDGLLNDDDPNGDNSLSDPLWLGNVAEYANDFDFSDNYSAFYLMKELNLGPKILILSGVRYEHVESKYTANETVAPQVFELPNTKEVKSKRNNEYWFPQVHLRYKASDWFDIRLSGTRTITRPDYKAISPYSFISSTKENLQFGNPNLIPALAKNFDVYLSFYSNHVGLFTIGGFYKEIENMIYSYSWTTIKGDPELPLAGDAAGVSVSTWRNNKDDAFIKGLEFDWQTNFWYLPSPFNNIVLNINYTRIVSDTKYPYNYVESIPIPTFPFKEIVRVESKRSGRFLNQPDDILNVALGYDIKGFSTRLSVLYQGNTTRTIGNLNQQDSFTKDYLRFDISVKQKLPIKGLEIFCNLNNITDRFDETYQHEETFFRDTDQYGLTMDIGFKYSN